MTTITVSNFPIENPGQSRGVMNVLTNRLQAVEPKDLATGNTTIDCAWLNGTKGMSFSDRMKCAHSAGYRMVNTVGNESFEEAVRREWHYQGISRCLVVGRDEWSDENEKDGTHELKPVRSTSQLYHECQAGTIPMIYEKQLLYEGRRYFDGIVICSPGSMMSRVIEMVAGEVNGVTPTIEIILSGQVEGINHAIEAWIASKAKYKPSTTICLVCSGHVPPTPDYECIMLKSGITDNDEAADDTGIVITCDHCENSKTLCDRKCCPIIPSVLYCSSHNAIHHTNTLCHDCRENSKSYVCISHVWGPPNFVQSNIKGVNWQVQADIDAKVEAVTKSEKRLFSSDTWIWMDNICMDQENNATKALEFKKMGSIYGESARCYIVANSEDVYDELKWDSIVAQICMKELKNPNTTNNVPDGFVEFYAQHSWLNKWNWVSRVWTLQEALLSRRLYLVSSGDMLLDIHLYTSSIMGAISQGSRIAKSIFDSCKDESKDLLEYLYKGFTKDSLGAVLNVIQKRQCTIDLDKVYGILGLLSVSIPVDYNKSITQVIEDLMLAALKGCDDSCLAFSGKPSDMLGRCVMPDLKDGGQRWLAEITVEELSDERLKTKVEWTDKGLNRTWPLYGDVTSIEMVEDNKTSALGGIVNKLLEEEDDIEIISDMFFPIISVTDSIFMVTPRLWALCEAAGIHTNHEVREQLKEVARKEVAELEKGLGSKEDGQLMICNVKTDHSQVKICGRASSTPQAAVKLDSKGVHGLAYWLFLTRNNAQNMHRVGLGFELYFGSRQDKSVSGKELCVGAIGYETK